MKTIPFGLPCISNEEISAVKKVIESKWIGSGPITQEFERKFKIYKKSKYALSVNSCTAALHLSLRVLGIQEGDEVITTPLTFCSTINSIILTGAKPVLVDIDKETLNIDETKIEKKITKKTKAMIIVHFAGLPCNMYPIMKIAKKYKIKIIEDCAHAIESKYYGKNVGNFGVTGCHSFYATKNLTTGEGGMIISSNKHLSSRLNIMRLHGISKDAWKRYLPENVKANNKYEHYDVKEIGLKYNLTDLSSAMGLVQLKKIERHWKLRKKIYEYYRKKLNNLPLLFQKIDNYDVKHAYHLFTLIIDKKRTKKKRDKLISFLKKNKINVGVNYRSVTEMTIYKRNFKWNEKTCVNSNYVGKNTLSLPLYPSLQKKRYLIYVKKFMNFLKSKVLFRCDAATIAEIGTGHIFRCLTIAKYLKKKFKLKNKEITFLIRSVRSYKIGLKILKKYDYNIIQIKDKNLKLNSKRELKYLNKNQANLLIIDRLDKTNMKFVKGLKNKFLKKIIIDDSSNFRKLFDLSLNPLTPKVKKLGNNSYVGFNYLILPAFFHKFKKKLSRQKNIFISFGGYDHKNLTITILRILNKLNLRLNIYISKFFEKSYDYSKLNLRIHFFNQNQYLDCLEKSKISITAGGMSLFDNILMKKKIICIPQYKHQEITL